MKNKKNVAVLGIVGILLIGILMGIYFMFFYNPWKFKENRPIKILWLNSYSSELEWSHEQYQGFKDFLDLNDINYELGTFHMDTKNKNSEEEKRAVGEEAIKFIEEFKPDLIYATDDNAQKYVGIHYINSDMPWVFSGVNAEAEAYNYDNAENIAGLLERELFIGGIEFLKTIDPSMSKIGVISDSSDTATLVTNYLNSSINNCCKFKTEVIGWHTSNNFDDYKSKVLEYNKEADVLMLLSINTIKDKEGKIVPEEDIIKWTVENSNIPEISSLHIDVEHGALLAIETTGYDTGYEAGKIATQILVEGVPPQDIGLHAPRKGERFVNYARAQDLGLKIPSDILIDSEVFEKF